MVGDEIEYVAKAAPGHLVGPRIELLPRAQTGMKRPVVDDVVAVGAAAPRPQDGRRVHAPDPERVQIAEQLARLHEAEASGELEAIGRRRHAAGCFQSAASHRPSGEELQGARDHPGWHVGADLGPRGVVGGVHEQAPEDLSSAIAHRGQHEVQVAVAGVEHQQQVVVVESATALVRHVGRARDVHREARRSVVVPVHLRHRRPVVAEPRDRRAGRPRGRSGEGAELQERVRLAQAYEPPREVQQRRALGVEVPVVPGRLVVLAVRVVVASLRPPELVAAADHGNPARQQQRGEQVPLLAAAVRNDRGVLRLALDPAVVGPVVVDAVAAALLVGLVVLLVVRDQVPQRHPVVGRHEVDARGRATALALVQVGAPGEPRPHLGRVASIAAPERAHGVTECRVPFAPAYGKMAHLVAAFPHVPGLGDELHVRQGRVLVDDREEAGEPVDLVQTAREGGGQVEAQAVHVHLGHPVANRVHDQAQHLRVPHVERVAGARVVEIEAWAIGDQPVIGGVVEALQAQRGPLMVALGGMVVDDVEDDLDACAVQGTHHLLELDYLVADARPGPVANLRRKVADGAVAPVVADPLLEQMLIVDELMNREQLDRGDAQLDQVVEDRRSRDGGVGPAQLLWHAGMAHRQTPDVRLVEDAASKRDAGRRVALPVEGGIDDHSHRGGALIAARTNPISVGAQGIVREPAA